MEYTDRHRAEMDAVKSLAQLDALLSRGDMLKDFVEYAKRNDIEPNEADVEAAKSVILAQLRAYIGRNALHDESGFYYNIYPIDNTMQRAVKELSKRINKTNKK